MEVVLICYAARRSSVKIQMEMHFSVIIDRCHIFLQMCVTNVCDECVCGECVSDGVCVWRKCLLTKVYVDDVYDG